MTEEKAMPAAQFFDGGVFYVGVSNGSPIIAECGDSMGDSLEVTLFPKIEHALERFHNVRRVRLMVDPEPVRPPESWGAIEAIEASEE